MRGVAIRGPIIIVGTTWHGNGIDREGDRIAMLVAVTGASGHIGANLIRMLADDGYQVRVLKYRDDAAFANSRFEVVEADITNRNSLIAAFKGVDIVHHCAARITLDNRETEQLERINVNGTENVLEACRICQVRRLVYFSSLFALDQQPLSEPLDETRSPVTRNRQVTPYDYSKAVAESRVHKAVDEGQDAVILYPTGVFGPHDYKGSHLGDAIVRLAEGRMFALVQGACNWVDVRDVARGAILAQRLGRRGQGYILGGEYLTIRALAQIIEEISGVPAPWFSSPLWLARTFAPISAATANALGKRPLYTSASLHALTSNSKIVIDKAVNDLSYSPRPIRESLMDTILWYSQSGRLSV